MLTDGTAYKTGESEDLDNKEWKELLDVGIDMCRRAVPDWYRLSFQTKNHVHAKDGQQTWSY